MLVDNKYHVSYCSNIHPGEDWEQTLNSLKTYLPKIKKEVSPESPFGIGLRLSNIASLGLNEGSNLQEFKDWLDQNQFYVFTMNGFPYGNFHNERVKDMVHAPDWTTSERLDYTKRLFDQLAFLIPEGISGGISTSPVSYRHWHTSSEALHEAFTTGAESMAKVVLQLVDIERITGKSLHLDIEPEPDGMMENSDEVLHFYEAYLIPIATRKLMDVLGCDKEKAKELILKHITVCYDVCHFSLAYEEPEYTLGKFRKAGIKVGKIQVSSALKILFKEGENEEIWRSLAQFDEPTYLHQVTEKVRGKVVTYKDLAEVLEKRPKVPELRSHFHVPIFLEKYDNLFSTQDQIIKVLEYLKKDQFSDQLEIETYTWDVLPKNLKTELSNSIVRELEWLKSNI
ncbi:metabolite traffic protein EboE [Arenibacter sp. BSSL-BM3]|uniref:Metabolite traffic protein EboE n=1 Tax=Arenibacter arenosicollis TaxID=2762274 RepID=A0ABR7QNH1_9FLAO|nr:metabolite traffic protein EboE [Arenibacter arenosicollis]MBC8768716.1 metabolite traffic protein EboE [Arenibacter arenosicollis]